jgi:hypothetical protein
VRRTTRVLACSVLGLSLATTAACGSAADGKSNNAASASASPAKVMSVAELSKAPYDQLLKHKNVRIIIKAQEPGGEMSGGTMIMAVNGTNLEFSITVETPAEGGKPAETMQMVMLKDAFYMQMGGEEVAPGKPWAKVSPDSNHPMAKIFSTMAKGMAASVDPRAAQEHMAAGGVVEATRQEQLNGAPVTHYTIKTDLAKAVNAMDLRKLLSAAGGESAALTAIPGLDEKTKEQLLKTRQFSDADLAKLKANMVKSVKGLVMTQEVWMDAQGMPVKMIMQSPDGKGKTIPVELAYSDWGKAPITVPPANQVAPMPDF